MTKNREKMDSTINGLEEYKWSPGPEIDNKEQDEQDLGLLIVELDFFSLTILEKQK